MYLYSKGKSPILFSHIGAKDDTREKVAHHTPSLGKAKNSEDGFDMKEWHKCVDHFFTYMMANFQHEMIVLGAKTALRDYQLPISHRQLKSFKTFHDRYGKYILED